LCVGWSAIKVLQAGAARLGAGDLDQRIEVKTGDELQALGDEFNRMARRLQGRTQVWSAKSKSARDLTEHWSSRRRQVRSYA
jgi:methyl-accepting chemotaxis protein